MKATPLNALIVSLGYSGIVWTLNVQFGLHPAYCYTLGIFGGIGQTLWWVGWGGEKRTDSEPRHLPNDQDQARSRDSRL